MIKSFTKNKPLFLLSIRLFIGLVIIRWLFDFNGLYGQDSHEYLRYARRLADFFQTGADPGDYIWPVNYPLVAALLNQIGFPLIGALQFISLASFVGVMVYSVRLIELLIPNADRKSAQFYVVLTLLPAPFLFQTAFYCMSDLLAIFLTVGAFFHVFQFKETAQEKDFYLAVFFGTLAFMTRYLAGLILLFPAIYLFILLIQQKKIRLWVWAAIIMAICMFPHFYIRGAGSGDFIAHNWLVTWSPKHWFMWKFTNIEGEVAYRYPNLVFGFSNLFYPGFIFWGILLWAFVRKNVLTPLHNRIVFGSFLVYCLFIAGMGIQNMRYLLMSFPLAIVLFYPAFSQFRDRFLKRNLYVYLFATFIFLTQAGLIYKYTASVYHLNRLEQTAAQKLQKYADQTLYTFWIDGALKSYGYRGEIINLWYDELAEAKPNTLILFNEAQFAKQWENKNPMINWRMIKANYQLVLLDKFSGGWGLYRIEEQQK